MYKLGYEIKMVCMFLLAGVVSYRSAYLPAGTFL